MIQLSEILRRLRGGVGTNEIHRELNSHKTVIRRLRLLALEQNWLDLTTPLPEENRLSELYYAAYHKNSHVRPHILDQFKDDIRKWHEAGESFVVIRIKINQRLSNSAIKDTALRDYCHKHFPRQPQPVLRRETEPSVAELDFGYFGKTFDDGNKTMKKTWFISVRFRQSRHAYREKIFHTDCETVILAVIRSFHYFNGAPKKLVIDNFKAAVIKAHKTDPTIASVFYEFVKHYGVLLSPCPPYDPNKKGGVETDVKYVKRNFWPLYRDQEKQRGNEKPGARRINEYFETWNREIASVRPIHEAGKKTPMALFPQDYDQLLPLPEEQFEFYKERQTVLSNDWHVRFDNVRYSAPYKYISHQLLIKANRMKIRVFSSDRELIAIHNRSYEYGAKITVAEHGPMAAIEYLQSHQQYLLDRALGIGSATSRVVETMLNDKVIDRTSSARGIVFLTKKYPAHRIERACERALHFHTPYYQNIKNILEKGLDSLSLLYPVDDKEQVHFIFERNGQDYNLN